MVQRKNAAAVVEGSAISATGNSLLRFLLVEAASAAVRSDPDWRRKFIRFTMRREHGIAEVGNDHPS